MMPQLPINPSDRPIWNKKVKNDKSANALRGEAVEFSKQRRVSFLSLPAGSGQSSTQTRLQVSWEWKTRDWKKEKDRIVSHNFTQSALRVVLLLHGQLPVLRLIQLLLQDLDLLPHHLHDPDRFVFVKIQQGNRDKSKLGYRTGGPVPRNVTLSSEKELFFCLSPEAGSPTRGGWCWDGRGSFQEIYGEFLQSCEELWSWMTSRDLGGEGSAFFSPQKRCAEEKRS